MIDKTIVIEELLRKIVNRAGRTEKAGSTEIMVATVPAGLLQEAADFLGINRKF